MNLEAVENILYDITEMFFKGATIVWTEQMNTQPPLPYVTLNLGDINRTSFPIVDEDGNRYYPCSTMLEVNLYTKGKPVTIGENVTGNYANTAVSDLTDFFNFLDSDNGVDILAGKGVTVSLVPPVRDLTNLQNDRNYRYRAMAEATVSFAMEADGPFGTASMEVVPNYSGGGTSELAEATTDTIEEIVITEGGNDNDEE